MRVVVLCFLSILACGCNKSGIAPETRTPTNFLFVGGSGKIAVYSIDPNLGTLTAVAGSPFSICSSGCTGLIQDSHRNLVLAADASSGTRVLSVNGTTGVPSPVALYGSIVFSSALTAALIPNSSLLFTASAATSLGGYSYSGAGLIPEPGSPFTENLTGSPNLDFLAADVFQRFLFVSTGGPNQVATFTFAGGVPSLASSVNVAGLQGYLVVEPTGQFLYVGGSADILIFSINQTTGALVQLANYPMSNVSSISADQLNHLFFAYDSSTPQVIPFRMNNGGSSLTQLTSTVIPADNAGSVGLTGQYYYSISSASGLYVHSVNQTTGALTLVQTLVLSFTPSSIYEFTFYH